MSAPDTGKYCTWSRSFSIGSVWADALWQCAVLRVTSWFLSFCMSQSHPSISRGGLTLTSHISLTLTDTWSPCAWQDGLLRNLNKNGNSDRVDTLPRPLTKKKRKEKKKIAHRFFTRWWFVKKDPSTSTYNHLDNIGKSYLYLYLSYKKLGEHIQW